MKLRETPDASFARAYADASDEDIVRLTRLVEESGGREATERFIAQQVELALAAVEGGGLDDEAFHLCAEFAGVAAGRTK